MAKTFNSPKKLGLLSEEKPKTEEISSVALINQNKVLNKAMEDTEAGLSSFTLDNAPQDYKGLKEQVKFFADVNAVSFIFMAHRLKIIRDGQLYREDGYADFKAFVDGELSVQRQTIYKYIAVFENFGDSPVRHASLEKKFSNYYTAVPYIKRFPERKEEIAVLADSLSRKNLEETLKERFAVVKSVESQIPPEKWETSLSDLIAKSKTKREGMKPEIVRRDLKEDLNWHYIAYPKNRTIKKMMKLFEELQIEIPVEKK